MDSAIVAAADRLEELLADDDVVDFYNRRFKAMCDETSAWNYAIETGFKKGMRKGVKEGKAEGLEKGLAEGLEKGRAEKLEIARKMKAFVRPLLEIAEITGLSPEVVEKLQFLTSLAQNGHPFCSRERN
jgi:predicted transposase YdaD